MVRKAAEDLKNCKHFVTVLEGILAVGNHLNGREGCRITPGGCQAGYVACYQFNVF